MALVDNAVVFLVSLLVGALGIHVGVRVVTGVNDYEKAVITALVGAIVWTVAGWLFGWLPGLGPVLVVLSYAWVIKRRYPGGWLSAGAIALLAWLASLVVLSLLASAGFTEFGAFGVPRF